ncbi:hypothetical protein KAT80_01510 [Candidatus Pacearchaeota archaeon]|nr:hypothetical protein [Candidatus Pacearchaeota archaeon]
MNLDKLEEIGFTQRERKVYVALLEIGLTSVGAIIKKSGIPSSKIYETLDKLIKKGLVSFVVKNNKKYYQPSNPKTILKFMDEKKTTIEKDVLPQLERLYNFTKQQSEATIYEGVKGIKTIYERMLKELKKGDTLYVLGAPSKANELLEGYFLDYHKRRIKAGIKMKILYDKEAKKYGRTRKKMNLTQVKYILEGQTAPSWIDIFSDCIVIFNLNKNPSCFLIKEENIAKNFKLYFELLWKTAESN